MENKKSMKNLILLIGALVVIGGGAFYGGMQYDRSKISAGRAGRFQGINGAGISNRTTGGGNFTSGEILSKDDKSITIKLPDGGSKIVFMSSSTQITKSAAGTLGDLTLGLQVSANGTANTDGSINAESVQIRPNLPAAADAAKTTNSANK